ncbi:MAG: (2Fe-2S)-binding protein [Planctomycetes bacterium]|nr:(2Fe-2S)-binding protein [Planctomycetota bacterium]MCB9912385.1 (2Fe-2S)-binding protein [Planctomycetota bacterium]HPF15473.1 2Fe-2S iron-sulfur cluster-binding protein [Planctomycetota bacterium]HRV80318.1 2Fe-2S iron-sulfur cluster-binding protein [Planctomycetota bacterium]
MPKLTLTDTGDTFEIPADTSLIEFAQERGLSLQFGCTMGSCGVCCVIVESGMENLSPISDVELETTEMVTSAKNARLACQVVIQGDVALRSAD